MSRVQTVALIAVAFLAVACPISAARIKRQAAPEPESGALNLTAIISALDLTPYLQSANAQVNQAVANLTAALQSQTPAAQEAANEALEGLNASTQNLTASLQQFLTNFQNQLNATGSEAQANLTSAINQLQTYYNSSGPALQQLINAVGSNITSAVQTLQSEITTLNNFLQSGLNNLTKFTTSSVQQSIAALQNSLNTGALNQTLATLVAEFNGQTLNFQTALRALRQQAGSSFQSVLSNIQNGMQSFVTFFQNLFSGFFQNNGTITVSPQAQNKKEVPKE